MFKFNEYKQKNLINKYQKIYKKLINEKDEKRKIILKQQLKKIEGQLYPMLYELQSMIINTKVLRKSKKVIGGSSLIEGRNEVFEDLVIHQVQQMFQYLPRVNTSRKVFSIMQKIQNISSQIHFHKFYQTNDITVDIDDEKDENNISPIDKFYIKNNPYEYEIQEMKLIKEQLGIIDEDDEEINKEPSLNIEIFELIEKIIRLQYIHNSKGMLNKLHVINTCLYKKFNKFNEDFYHLRDMIQRQRSYNIQVNTFNGLKKITKMIINEYIQNDPNIQIGEKQIKYYVSLLLYVMIMFGYIEKNKLSNEELKNVNQQKKLFDSINLKYGSLFDKDKKIQKKLFLNNKLFETPIERSVG